MDSELPGLKDHGKHYPSSNYIDELAWGSLWLYFATAVSSTFLEVYHLLLKVVDCLQPQCCAKFFVSKRIMTVGNNSSRIAAI